MISKTKRLLALLSVTSMVLLGQPLGSSPVHAVACDELFTAPAGDAPNDVRGGDGENLDQLDIISGGIVAEGGGTFTTQIKVKDLSNDIPSNATSINWYFVWFFSDVWYFTRARVEVTSPDAVYSYGTYDPELGRFTTTDATSGAFKAGPKGTVQVQAPLDGVGSPAAGATLSTPWGVTYVGQGVPGVITSLLQIDRGPKEEDTYGTDYPMGTKCETGNGGGDLTSPKPRLSFGDLTPKIGKTIRALTKLKVCKGHKGTKIQLQRKVKTSFKTIATKRLNRECKAQFRVVANFKRATFRSYWKKQDDDHASSASKPKTVVTHK